MGDKSLRTPSKTKGSRQKEAVEFARRNALKGLAAPALDTPSDWGAKHFVDLNFKVSEPIRRKHWKEAAHRGMSSQRLYLMAMQAFYEKHGSLVERFSPNSARARGFGDRARALRQAGSLVRALTSEFA